MRIEKVINNNVISALDDQGREIVAMGRGIGFQKKSGQEIKAAQVEKIFHLGSPDLQARFQELLANMPMECVQVSDEIISYAKSHLSMQLNQNVYLALTDHIDFALRRFKDGMLFENALYSEIRRFYPEEFQIGCHALDLIEERIKVRLPEDEAASIAFHLVNSEFGGMRLRDTQIMTEIIRHLIGMIRADYHFPEDLVYEDRLITNLKFMLNRLIQNKEGWITEDARFNEFVRANYRNEYELARAMRDYIESVVSCKMTEEEVIYLAVQLKYADIKKRKERKMGFFDRFKKDKGIELTAPMKGKCVSIKEVPDPTFAEEILGKGIAVIPQDGHVYAPADGKISTVFPTGHAVGITTADGAEILIHIGLDTVELKGEPFEQKVKEGQDVKKGDLLVVADLDKIKASGRETITPMIICNSDAYEQVETFTGKDVETTDAVMKLHPAK